MDRRAFLLGGLTLSVAAVIPGSFTLAAGRVISFDDDMQDVIRICLNDRFPQAECLTDWLHMFEEEVEEKMKGWGTWKPLQEMDIISFKDGVEERRPSGWYSNPNFWDGCHHSGGFELDGVYTSVTGFSCSFRDPSDRVIKARYWHASKQLNLDVDTPEITG